MSVLVIPKMVIYKLLITMTYINEKLQGSFNDGSFTLGKLPNQPPTKWFLLSLSEII